MKINKRNAAILLIAVIAVIAVIWMAANSCRKSPAQVGKGGRTAKPEAISQALGKALPAELAPPAKERPLEGDAIEINLNGDWEFTEEGNDAMQWLPAKVPGCVHTDLLANRRIPDPFMARNELAPQIQDIEKKNYIYRKRFAVTQDLLARKRIDLVCDGLDTLTRIEIGGKEVASTDNMFRKWVIPLNSMLEEGVNTLEITFRAPMNELGTTFEQRLGPLPATNDRVGGSSFFRKAPYHFGWDWGPRLATCGIWRPIRILATNSPRIENIRTIQKHRVAGAAGTRTVELTVYAEIKAPEQGKATLQARVGESVVTKEIVVSAGAGEYPIRLTVRDPDLWWPNGMGAQKMYDLRVMLAPEGTTSQTAIRRIGFRTARLETKKDDTGVSFVMLVNDQPVFCKGANWIPCDSFPVLAELGVNLEASKNIPWIPRDILVKPLTAERYRSMLQNAVACNMNMLRVWGGGIYENDVFYDLCDEMGLMIWQDFMFSCSLYPGDKKFLDSVREEARDNVKRLMNHPSIVLWCGNNECESAIKNWYKKESTQWRHYEQLYHEALPEVIAALDPMRDYWPSSPHSVNSEEPGLPTDGDVHEWSVWHGSKPFEYFETVKARFVSEFGYQSFPPLRTIAAYAVEKNPLEPAGRSLNLTQPNVMHHQKNGGGNQRIMTQMMDRFAIPNGFANFVILSQLQQGEAMRTGVESWRRSMPVCMGTIYWQLDDCWPVTSWSSIDYFGRWKALQYFSRRFYEPVHVSCAGGGGDKEEKSDKPAKAAKIASIEPVSIWGTSDLLKPLNAKLTWKLQTYNGKVILAQGEKDWVTSGMPISEVIVKVPANDFLMTWDKGTSQLLAAPGTPVYTSENSYLTYRLTNAKTGAEISRGAYHFDKFKNIKLPKPTLLATAQKTSDGVEITIKTDVFAKWVWLEPVTEIKEGRFSDCFFDLDPGETKKITYSAPMPTRFIVKSLVDTYMENP
ncbi:MAG: hypothetical protein NTX50_18425 [Candidatus Sumerlaeota bacterium]|nr:hypothetical protein [Candidatus Sumerlaeota bacterium]